LVGLFFSDQWEIFSTEDEFRELTFFVARSESGDWPCLWPIVVQFCLWQWNGGGSWMGVAMLWIYTMAFLHEDLTKASSLFSLQVGKQCCHSKFLKQVPLPL
jgi:hypothetical protein